MGELLAIKQGNHYHKTIEITAMLDDSLSLQAKGLHYYMQTRPDNWKIWFSNLVKFSTNGETSVRSALKELSDSGYLLRVQLRNEKKQVMRMIYISLEKPNTFSELDLENLHLENLDLGFKVYSYNIYSNKTNRLSKDSNKDSENPISVLESSKKTIYKRNSSKTKKQPIKVDLPFLLKEWRTYPQIPKSQYHPKENSKIHSDINKYTNYLLDGTFGNHCSINTEFLDQHKISKSALSDKYSKENLSDAIYEMAKTFQEGYYPENKDSISKRSFANLIYCGRTHISYLLKYLCKDAQPLSYKTVQVYEDWLDKLYDERFFDKDIVNDNHQYGILKKGLFGIEEYFKWMKEENIHSQYRIKDEHDLFNWYVKWLDENGYNLTPYDIGPQSNKWYKFIKWLEEAIHGDFVNQYSSLDKRRYK